VKALAVRWLKFNFVGGVGIGAQLAALWLLKSRLGLNYLVATAIAVELAVLHNFVWHERFTWKDRAVGGWRAVAGRLLRFHAGNGLISIVGNLALMRLLVGSLRMPYLPANLLTIAICSFLNFGAGEWYVFRQKAE
jgi:putative flippase GtrA